MEQAGGEKKALDTLERLEQKRDDSMEQLQRFLKELETSESSPELEKKVLTAANRVQSQVNQADAVGRMVRDNTVKNKDGIAALVARAGKAAAQKAESTAATLMSWGYGPDSNDPKKIEADRKLVERVSQSKTLMEVAPYPSARLWPWLFPYRGTGVLLDQGAVGFSFSLKPFCTEILRTSQLTQESIAQRLLEQRI